VTAREPFIADGAPRAVTAEGCTGTERIEFSDDQLRAYTRSDFECDGDPRTGTGVMSFVSPSEWIDVRSLTVAGEPVAWAQHYELAAPSLMAAAGIEDPAGADRGLERAARVRAARGLAVADVEEAVTRIDTRAVEVWVAAHETALELDGSELIRLADAGVPESVIDVMIAVSYPERFVLSPEGAAEEVDATVAARDYPAGYRRGYRSYLFDPFYSGYGYGLGYSRFGYYGGGFGGYGGGYWGYRPATIIVQPVEPSEPQTRGRMVPGRGYTRGTGGSSSGGSVTPSVSDGGGGSSGGGGGGGGGGGSSSDDSGRASTGRTAQPRN
jgi:hypothetical protein